MRRDRSWWGSRFWVAVAAILCSLSGCGEPPVEPPVTLGELTLTRAELVPERYTLEIPIFNSGRSQLKRYRISAQAAGESSPEETRVPTPVAFVVDEPLEARTRTVHTMTFDCPLPVTPPDGLSLQEITFHDFHFDTGTPSGVIEYGYPVEEAR
ncbi:MAG: hypothetical protein ACOCU4_01660 [Alkalispirochaeta sp.]